MQDGLGQTYALPVALGKLADFFVGHVGYGAFLHGFVNARLEIRRGHSLDPADESQVFNDFHFRINRRRFRQVADALFDFHGVLPDVEAGHGSRAIGGRQEAGEHTRMVVVLPAPLGPRKPTICPLSTSKEM